MNTKTNVLALGLGVGLLGIAMSVAGEPTPPANTQPKATTSTRTTNTTVDTARVADTLVKQCAGIESGQIVLITGGTRDQQLLEDIAIGVRKLGAHPLITLESDRLERLFFTDVSTKFDTQQPEFALKIADIIDAQISVDATERPDLLADIADQRVFAHVQAYQPVQRKLMDRKVLQVELGNGLYPTTALAERFGIPQSELSKIFWNAVTADYTDLQTIGRQVQTRLAAGKTAHIIAPNGTDLTVEIAKRPVFVSDGVISSEDRFEGGAACQVWLPAGEVYVTPVAGTATGTFIADTFFYEGKLIEGLTFKFANGKLTSMTAKGDMTALKKAYDAAGTGKDLFAALDIGINPNITVPPNSRMVTWMAAGTISVGVGGNEWAGGDNTAAFDVFAHLLNGTLTIDGTPLIEKGKLLTK